MAEPNSKNPKKTWRLLVDLVDQQDFALAYDSEDEAINGAHAIFQAGFAARVEGTKTIFYPMTQIRSLTVREEDRIS